MKAELTGKRILASLQENAKLIESLGEEVRFQAKTFMTSQCENLDLVSREEFETTLGSLDRAIKRIENLENLLSEQS